MYLKKDRIAAAIILLVTFAIFRLSPVHTVFDSRYEMFFSEQLLRHHSFSFDPGAIPELRAAEVRDIHPPDPRFPYQLVRVNGRIYYLFPLGTVILSMPYVALANAMGISAIDQDGVYDSGAEIRIQEGLAALLMAAFSVVIFWTSRVILSFRWSLLITAATALGTQVWSTASRAMWSQTWGILILAFVVWLILRAEVKQARLPPVLLALCLSCLYFVRPTFCIAIVCIAFYMLVFRRKDFLPFALTGGICLAAFVAFSKYHFDKTLPVYYHAEKLRFFSSFPEGFAGSLISPSRGLLVYVPVILFFIYLSLRYSRRWRLVLLSFGVILGHLIMISLQRPWYGGHCYGARMSADVIPWFALLGMLGVEGRLQWRERNREKDLPFRVRTEWSFGLVLLVCSVLLNGIAAISYDVWRWNVSPTNVDHDRGRLWDWRHPQFLGVPYNPAPRVEKPDS